MGAIRLPGLEAVFGPETFSIVSDNEELVGLCRAADASAATFAELVADVRLVPENAVAISSSYDTLPSTETIEQLLGTARMLLLPQASFDGTIETCTYALGLLGAIDWAANAERTRDVCRMLQTAASVVMRSPRGTALELSLGDEINVVACKEEPDLLPGEWAAIASYIEVGLIPPRHSSVPRHSVSGTLVADGFAVAHHRASRHLAEPRAGRAWGEVVSIYEAKGFPLRVEVRHSRVREIRSADGRDVTADLLGLVDPELEDITIEVAFSTNVFRTRTDIDWLRNSPLNEAAGGIHVGIGAGVTGAHIDLVDTSCIWTPVPAQSQSPVSRRHRQPV